MRLFFTVLTVFLSQFANPFVGTDQHGHTFPGAAYPFGMVQLSPDTRPRTGDWDGCSGYHYSDSLICGFSHTHLSGTGCDDLCDVLLMPVSSYPSDKPERELYRSPFSHDSEKASPGYYEVFLDKPGVLVRLTAGRRCGIHEYTFRDGDTPEVVLDLRHRDNLLESSVNIIPGRKTVLTGCRRSRSWAADQPLYYCIEFSAPVEEFHSDSTGAVLKFAPHRKSNKLTVRVAVSSHSVEGAVNNLRSEGNLSFKRCLRKTQAEWERYFSLVECPFSDTEHSRIFYTALYHTAIHPSLYSDVDGRYRIAGGREFKAEGYDRYTTFSLWDTFRGLNPLISMLRPDLTLDFLKSFQSICDENGKLPIWELWGNETNCMIGYNSAPVVADALARGIDDFDVDAMLQALLVSSRRGDFGLDSFRANGLVLSDDEHESVSKTLEYAYDDWCVAQVAKWLLDHQERSSRSDLAQIYEEYMTSAQYWRNVFDPQTGFMRARHNGGWVKPFDPREVNNNYTEANSWQYSFFVPHDIAGLMEALGGPEAFCDRLDSLFESSTLTTGRTQADITGQIGQYAHGNEPSHHIPYLYAIAGQPEKTDRRVFQIMETLYTSAPDGLCGNDDCGQMSAWYVLSALGRYPVCPGIIENTLTSVPKTIVTNPWFEYENDYFEGETVVSVKGEGNLFYRIDDGEFQPYCGPFTIDRSCQMEAYGEIDGTKSFVSRCHLHRLASDKAIEIRAHYNRQYTAGGDEGLIDGVRGALNWRTGGWQGYQDQDFEAVVDLLQPRDISAVCAGFCQDARSWIWMPRHVDFSISADGVNYTPLPRIENTVEEQDYEIQIKDFEAAVPSGHGPVRYVKVFAKNFGTIPEWHMGAGGEGFIFIDEIWVK